MQQVPLGTRILPRGCKSDMAQRGHILQDGPPSLSAGRSDWNSHKDIRNRGERLQHQQDTAAANVIIAVSKDGSINVNRFSYFTLLHSK